jgi:hypothetical protein
MARDAKRAADDVECSLTSGEWADQSSVQVRAGKGASLQGLTGGSMQAGSVTGLATHEKSPTETHGPGFLIR